MFRVISIDGGGARTLLSTYIIRELQILLKEENIPFEFSDFDLYAGTSAGSIVASFLSIHKSPQEICELFEEMIPHIFPKERKKMYANLPRMGALGIPRVGAVGSKYETKTLNNVLNQAFQTMTFQDVYKQYQSRLMIATMDINPVGSRILKTPYVASAEKEQYIYLKDAITVSCAAPTYFDPYILTFNNPHASSHTREFCGADGGLFLGNPSMAALIEGLQCIEEKADTKDTNYMNIKNIKVLSIGSLLSGIRYEIRPAFWWKWGIGTGWKGAQFVDSVMEIQKAHVHNMMKRLVPDNNYLRLECDMAEKIDIDLDVERYQELFRLKAQELVRIQRIKILSFFRDN